MSWRHCLRPESPAGAGGDRQGGPAGGVPAGLPATRGAAAIGALGLDQGFPVQGGVSGVPGDHARKPCRVPPCDTPDRGTMLHMHRKCGTLW